MTVHIIAIILALISIEIVYYFQLAQKYSISFTYMKKILYTTTSKNISDHWKEKSILKFSQLLLSCSLKIIGILMLIVLLYSIASYLYKPFSSFIISMMGILETTVIVIVYLYLRRFIYAKL